MSNKEHELKRRQNALNLIEFVLSIKASLRLTPNIKEVYFYIIV